MEYKLERYYSPREGKLYEAELPDGEDGVFGVDLKAFIVYLYYACRVTENKIKKILEETGILISGGEISTILTQEKKEELKKENEEIVMAGVNCSNYIPIDDTGIRHKGINHHAQVICNELFSAIFITCKKNRSTVRGIFGLEDGEKIDKILISDDAGQFDEIAVYHALCWIHEIRLYTKLNPHRGYHRDLLQEFLERLWGFYDKLNK